MPVADVSIGASVHTVVLKRVRRSLFDPIEDEDRFPVRACELGTDGGKEPRKLGPYDSHVLRLERCRQRYGICPGQVPTDTHQSL